MRGKGTGSRVTGREGCGQRATRSAVLLGFPLLESLTLMNGCPVMFVYLFSNIKEV